MLGLYAAGLAVIFVGGIINDVVDPSGSHTTGSLWDIVYMAPYVVLLLAAAVGARREVVRA